MTRAKRTTRKREPRALTPKQRRFVAEFLVDLNATAAAKRAGYSARTAEQQGYENLRKPEIAAAIAGGKAQQLEKADLSAARVLEELRRLAFMDIRGLFTRTGDLVDVTAWTAEHGSAVASIEVLIKNAKAGDGITDTVHKVKLWDKVRALEALAKHYGLLIERVKVEGDEELVERLKRGRERARSRS